METKESFDEFCQQLELEEECREKAWNVWESVSTKVIETTKSALIPWFICAIFVTNCHKQYNGTHNGKMVTSHSMSKLLKAAKMRMVEFFQKMKVFVTLSEVGRPVTDNLTELKKTFCVSAGLFYKFKRLMPIVFKDHQVFRESEETQETFCQTCWLLFIVCKGWQPAHQVTDLVTAFNLLLCCVDYVHKRFIQLQPTGLPETNGNLIHLEILPNLCQESSVPYSEVNAVYTEYFQPFLESCSENTRDLLNVDELNSMYEEIYNKSKDIDERDFFDKDGYLWIPFDSETDSTATINGGAANTPVHDEIYTTTIATSTAVPESRELCLSGQSSLTDLRATLEEASHMQSQELVRFWMCCKRNPQNLIQSQLTVVQDRFIKGFNDTAVNQDDNTSIQIFVLAKKLYFRVMESMLIAEEKRLSCSDFSALLNSSAFHVSLLACSIEVVMAEQGLPSSCPALAFPWILGILRLEAFDFFKVTESFILHEPLLDSSLIKHLNRIEEQVLESLAWRTGSPFLTAMEASCPHSDFSTSNSAQQRKKSQPLNLFLRKVNQLAYHRLTLLCNKLDVDDITRGHMWTCLEQSLRLHWQLIRDRHLDQMLLCAVYAISKVVGKEIQFKQIVASYKGLPFACAQVYRGTTEQDSIIGFYNKVYMVAMKSTILQFAPNKNPPVSPAPKSSLRVPGRRNFYLSPLKNSPGETLTPKTRSLYSFGESPGSGDRESLSRINASMRAAVHSQPKVPQKRLRFDDCDVTEPGPVLTNGHSTERETESPARMNGTNDSKEEPESKTTS